MLAAKGAADPQLLKDVKALAAAAEESDGNPPLSEQTLVTLRAADAGAAGTLGADPRPVLPRRELRPGQRRRTWPASPSSSRNRTARACWKSPSTPATATRAWRTGWWASSRSTRGFAGLKAWSHGNHEAAAELAARYGYGPVRELWKMRLTSAAAELPDVRAARTA